MSYLGFHLIFTIPLLIVLACLNWLQRTTWGPRSWIGMFTLILLAFSYTSPWDSYLIREGVWSYPPDRILGTLWSIPYEELSFFVIQTVIGCLWASLVLNHFGERKQSHHGSKSRFLPMGALVLLALVIIGWSLSVATQPGNGRYLALILAWALPVLLLQSVVGHVTLRLYWREGILSVMPLTLYLWLADSYAISCGIWTFPEGQSTGIELLQILPLEEALFFFLTNCMVVQGYILVRRMPLPLGETSNARV